MVKRKFVENEEERETYKEVEVEKLIFIGVGLADVNFHACKQYLTHGNNIGNIVGATYVGQ